MLTTAVSIGLTLRLTIDCAAVMMWPATSTGSIAACGCAPWPPRPSMVISMRSAAAIAGPGVMPIRPGGSPGQLCSAIDLARPESARTVRPRSSPWRRRSPPRPAGRSDRRCRRSCGSRADSARRRAASSCGRRGRSRASGHRGATCARTRSPPASAAHPCRRAGRSRGRSQSRLPRTTATTPVLPMPAWCSMPSARQALAARRARCGAPRSRARDACAGRGARAVNSACQRRMCSTGLMVTFQCGQCAATRSMRSRGSTA